MKATMSAQGVITIIAETGAETFALNHWATANIIKVDDVMRGEQRHIRGSALQIATHVPTTQQTGKL